MLGPCIGVAGGWGWPAGRQAPSPCPAGELGVPLCPLHLLQILSCSAPITHLSNAARCRHGRLLSPFSQNRKARGTPWPGCTSSQL
jgi:hypothetical protein